jgi:O-antigen/teichoic acid export membrane protein
MNLSAFLPRRLAGFARRNPDTWQTLAAFSVKLFGAAISFLFNFLIARHFGASGTGGYGLALTTSTVGGTFALFGLDYILLRTVAGDLKVGAQAEARGTVRAIGRGVAGIAFGIAVLLFILGVPLLLRLLEQTDNILVLYYSALAVVPFAMTRLASAALRGAGQVVLSQWVDGQIATTLALGSLVALIVVAPTAGVDTLFLCFVAAQFVAACYAWWRFGRLARGWPQAAPVALAPLLGQGWKVSFVVLSMLLADWIVLLMLGANYSVLEIGQFRTAMQIAALVNIIVVTFDSVAGPRIAAAHRVGESAGVYRAWRQATIIMTVMAAPLLGLCLAVPEWILHFFGPEFVAGAPALQILAAGQLINVLTGPAGSILIMTGREDWSLRISCAALVMLAILGLTLVPAYGIVGAALTASGITVFRKLVACWVILRR